MEVACPSKALHDGDEIIDTTGELEQAFWLFVLHFLQLSDFFGQGVNDVSGTTESSLQVLDYLLHIVMMNQESSNSFKGLTLQSSLYSVPIFHV